MRFLLPILCLFVFSCDENNSSLGPQDGENSNNNSIIGTWQVVYRFHSNDINCDPIDSEYFGPIMEYDYGTDICNNIDCLNTEGYCMEQINPIFSREEWYRFSDNGDYYQYTISTFVNTIESLKIDNECDGIFDVCTSAYINGTHIRVDIGYYTFTSNSLSVEDEYGYEIEDGSTVECYDCSESDCTNDVHISCGTVTNSGTDDDEFIFEFSDDRLILRKYNQEYDECHHIELVKSNNHSIGGCLDSASPFFNPIATFDDGSCVFNDCNTDY